MKVYPPVDSHFFQACTQLGMPEDEIEQDWKAYCDDMEQLMTQESHEVRVTKPVPKPRKWKDIVNEFIKNLKG